MIRYFRAEDEVYEQARLLLDAAWRHPTQDGLTQTCIAPAAIAPHGDDGLAYLAVYGSFCEYDAVAEILPALLSSGAVEEIDREQYMSGLGWEE